MCKHVDFSDDLVGNCPNMYLFLSQDNGLGAMCLFMSPNVNTCVNSFVISVVKHPAKDDIFN